MAVTISLGVAKASFLRRLGMKAPRKIRKRKQNFGEQEEVVQSAVGCAMWHGHGGHVRASLFDIDAQGLLYNRDNAGILREIRVSSSRRSGCHGYICEPIEVRQFAAIVPCDSDHRNRFL